MDRKKTLIYLIILIFIAAVFGLILLNKGDGPVSGCILSNSSIETVELYKKAEDLKGDGIYGVMASERNKLVQKYNTEIPQDKELYENIYLVECRKGTKIKIKWVYDSNMIKEEEKALTEDQTGVISYQLEGSKVKSGTYCVEAYYEDKKILSQNFEVK